MNIYVSKKPLSQVTSRTIAGRGQVQLDSSSEDLLGCLVFSGPHPSPQL